MTSTMTLQTARAAVLCPTCDFLLAGLPWDQAVQVGRCLACGLSELHVAPQPADGVRMVRWGEFPI